MLKRALQAAAAYAAIVFAAGFVLGTVRVLFVAPRLGALLAVLSEAPVMLAISWFVSAACIRAVRPSPASALAMGGTAFVLLQAAEMALAAIAFDKPPAAYVRELATPPGAAGLAAQVAFALFPVLQAGRRT
jgi:hypothetical protein